jgi:hypothetical protein
VSTIGTAFTIILTRVRGRSLARRIANDALTATPVAVYFADSPQSLYQLRRWYRVLEAVNAEYATVIITSDPATYNTVRRETKLAVTYASGAPELTRVLDRQQVRLVLYPNHNALNFRVLRFPTPVHVFIGHGESGKESSVSRQLKAYDKTFVADADSIAQLRTIRGYDADANAVVIGSPWLGFLGGPPSSWVPDDRTVVLYAPTWEGDRPSMDYSSVETLGDSIVEAVLGSPDLRLIYRPHPWLGRVRPASAAVDAKLRRAITASGRGDVIDTGEYGWSLGAAAVCITDVSSVAHDARALGKPLLLTVPTGAAVPPTPVAAFTGTLRLDGNQDSASIRALLAKATMAGSASPEAPSVSIDALRAAVGDALRLGNPSTL